jgi:hypothetical protein
MAAMSRSAGRLSPGFSRPCAMASESGSAIADTAARPGIVEGVGGENSSIMRPPAPGSAPRPARCRGPGAAASAGPGGGRESRQGPRSPPRAAAGRAEARPGSRQPRRRRSIAHQRGRRVVGRQHPRRQARPDPQGRAPAAKPITPIGPAHLVQQRMQDSGRRRGAPLGHPQRLRQDRPADPGARAFVAKRQAPAAVLPQLPARAAPQRPTRCRWPPESRRRGQARQARWRWHRWPAADGGTATGRPAPGRCRAHWRRPGPARSFTRSDAGSSPTARNA